MQKLTVIAFGFAIYGFAATTLLAENRIVPEDGAFEVMLLREESVREELKLTKHEAAKIDTYTSHQWAKAKEVATLPEAERDVKFKEMTKENHDFIDKTISKQQRKRLQEIELQIAGLMLVTRPEVSKKLNLTDDQKKRAHEIQKSARSEMEAILYAGSSQDQKSKLDELHNISQDKLRELLNDEQEKTWAQLTGPAFKGRLVFGKATTLAREQ